MSRNWSRRTVLRNGSVVVAAFSGCMQGSSNSQGTTNNEGESTTTAGSGSAPLIINNKGDKKHTVEVTVKKSDSGEVYKEKKIEIDASSKKKLRDFITERDVYDISVTAVDVGTETIKFEGDGVLGVRSVNVDIKKDGVVNVYSSQSD